MKDVSNLLLPDSINIEYLIKSLQSSRCILCIGPDFFSEPTGARQEVKLANFLREREEQLQIRVYDDGWFHSRGESEVETWQRVREFYEQTGSNESILLEKIAEIPFHLILSFTPDYRVRDAFKKTGASFFSFNKYEPLIIAGEPTSTQPLVINLLGELNNRNSLVLTQSDYFQFLKAIFEKKFFPELVKDQIAQAEYILFLGMSLDKWYLQLFMQLLKEYDRQKMTPSKKFSSDSFMDAPTQINCEEQFRILFDIKDVEVFVDTLHLKCAEYPELLKNKKNDSSGSTIASGSSVSSFHTDNWLDDIAKDNVEKVLAEIMQFMKAIKDEVRIREIALLTNRYHNLNNSFRQGLITRSEEITGRNNVINTLLQLIQSVQQNPVR